MKNFLTNWKTTVTGIAIILLTVGHALKPEVITTSVVVEAGALLSAAGFAAAKDGNVTGIGAAATTIESAALPLASTLTANSNNVAIEDVHKILEAFKGAQQPAPPLTVNLAPPAAADKPVVNPAS